MERIPAAMLKGNGADAEVTNAGGMLVFSSGGIAEVLTALDEYNRRMAAVLGRLRRLFGQSGKALDQIKPQVQCTTRTLEAAAPEATEAKNESADSWSDRDYSRTE